jgi:hypothetical protein
LISILTKRRLDDIDTEYLDIDSDINRRRILKSRSTSPFGTRSFHPIYGESKSDTNDIIIDFNLKCSILLLHISL